MSESIPASSLRSNGVITARYDSECGACGEKIRRGEDKITKVGAEWVHADCNKAAPARGPVCGTCFTELPLTLICGNCD